MSSSISGSDNQSKFREIYLKYSKFIYCAAKNFLKDDQRAEECALKSYEMIMKYISVISRLDSSVLKYYVYNVTYLNALRMMTPEEHYKFDDKYKIRIAGTNEDLENQRKNEEDELKKAEKTIILSSWEDILAAASEVLTGEDKFLLECRFGRGIPKELIAEYLGIPEHLCESRINHVKKRMASELEKRNYKIGVSV